MIDRLLQIHLEPVARDQRRWRRARALALGWSVAAAVGLFLLWMRSLSGWNSPWAFLLLALGSLVWLGVAWQQGRRGSEDYAVLARNIEQENPSLHALLLTAVEQQPNPVTGELNYLQDRVVRETLAQDRRHGWHARVRKRLVRFQFASTGALMLLIGVLVSLYRAAPPAPALLALVGRGVTVTPGDTSLEKGGSLVVLARFAGGVPPAATLVVRPANEPERRIPLAKNLDDPVFGASLAEVSAPLSYHVEYGTERTREFNVVVFEFPRLERADVRVSFPAYTGLPEKVIADTRRVSAVEGTDLEYTFHLNKPVEFAALVAKEGERISLRADTNRPGVYATRLKLERSGRYELRLVDEAGRTNKLPPLFVFEALTNRPPELKFAFPRGDQRVSALEEMNFQGEISDDFGLKAFGFAYNLAGQETRTIELGQAAGPHEQRAFNHQLALESLGAQPDQLLSYYLWAEDIGPDGNVRRTAGDMFFAEVRPFEEIFREGEPQDPNSAQQQQQQGQPGQNAAERLAELQKQIVNATWNLQRRETGKTPSSGFKADAQVVRESQENALEQVRARPESGEDSRSTALLESVEQEMESALKHLAEAAEKNSVSALPPALAAEQSAYQALLRLAAREYHVSRGQNRPGGQSGRGERAQRQLDQLDLRQTENRYETQRQAPPPQSPQQREQLQAFNRLKELAQRQQDVNERLKELQAALQEARTETEREELRRRLKRLQEEQQQMLADLDELRQRMERPENQSQMAEARQQLDQTRSEIQRAAEALERGEVPQALSSGTRAQRELQQLRDDFRRRNSSQFAEDMRELRSQARELAQQQDDIGQNLDALADPTQRNSLTDSDQRQEIASQLVEQKQRLDELVRHATEVTQQAEPVEPLLARQLYDTLRQAAQDDARNLQDTTNDLLSQGRMYRNVYDRLRRAKDRSERPVEVAADLLREGFSPEASNLERRARRSIGELKSGVERAAESVLGDDTEALRLARSELDELNRQLERELSRVQRQSNTNRAAGGRGELTESDESPPGGNQADAADQTRSANAQTGRERQRPGEGQAQAQTQSQEGQSGQGESSPSAEGQPSQARTAGAGQGETQELAAGNRPRSRDGDQRAEAGGGNQPGQRGGERGGASFLEQFGGEDGGGFTWGPITGPEYARWSDRLRDVEEMLDVPELRAEAARIRDRARSVRTDLKRHSKEPRWDVVKMEIAGPLLTLRARVAEELARRESKDALVPIDRDPVPTRYTELVRRYYEELGKSEPPGPTPR